MCHEADSVVKYWTLRKRLMTAFMGDHPDTRGKCATEEPIEWPKQGPAKEWRDDGILKPRADVDEERHDDDVTEKVRE